MKQHLYAERKRRTITNYENNIISPKDNRLLEISNILNARINTIKEYDFKEQADIVYTLMWLEELYPVYTIVNNKTLSEIEINKFLKYNVNKVTEYYNDFKEEKHGIKKDSKRYLAK